MKKLAMAFLVCAGCSTAPIADTLDHFKPGKIPQGGVAPYGGVCLPSPVSAPAPPAGISAGPTAAPPPGIPPGTAEPPRLPPSGGSPPPPDFSSLGTGDTPALPTSRIPPVNTLDPK